LATKKRSSGGSKSSGSSTRGRKKVEKVMHEYKHGELKSGGRKRVKNPKQAIAIALSEARQAGAKIPPKKGAAKKKAAKKSSSGGSSKKAASKKNRGNTNRQSKRTSAKKSTRI
jgi:hypothetical protein